MQHFYVISMQFVLWVHLTNPVVESFHASPSDISAFTLSLVMNALMLEIISYVG